MDYAELYGHDDINPKLLIRASPSYYNSPLKFGSTCIAGVELGCPTKFS